MSLSLPFPFKMKYSLAIGRKRLQFFFYHETYVDFSHWQPQFHSKKVMSGTTHTTSSRRHWNVKKCFPSFPDPWLGYIILLMCWSGICLTKVDGVAFLKAAKNSSCLKAGNIWGCIYFKVCCKMWGWRSRVKCQSEVSMWGWNHVRTWTFSSLFSFRCFIFVYDCDWVFDGFSQNQMNFQYEFHRPDSVHLTAEQFPGDFLESPPKTGGGGAPNGNFIV